MLAEYKFLEQETYVKGAVIQRTIDLLSTGNLLSSLTMVRDC